MQNTIMAFNAAVCETIYGFNTLDVLHNFFPEIMYDDTLFPNEMLRYMRYRMNVLFPTIFPRQQNLYRIYLASQRAPLARHWRAATTVSHTSPPTVTVSTTSAATSPATQTTAPAGVRPVQPPAISTARPRPANNPMEDLLTSLLSAPLQQSMGSIPILDLRYTTTHDGTGGTGTNQLSGLLTALWQDVAVAPTGEEIEEGSEIVEHLDVPEETTCAVCMERGAPQVWRKLHCSHYFHRTCIDRWFQSNARCPVCRADVREPASADA